MSEKQQLDDRELENVSGGVMLKQEMDQGGGVAPEENKTGHVAASGIEKKEKSASC